MLTYNPKKRCTAAEALEHKWINNASPQHLDEKIAKDLLGNLANFKVYLFPFITKS
jgi:hypothetical protein